MIFIEFLKFSLVYLLFSYDLVACIPFFPWNSTHGVFAALAIPLDLPHRQCFISYNFEANYNSPYTWDIPPILEGIENEAWFEHEMERSMSSDDCNNCTSTAAPITSTTTENSRTSTTSTTSKNSATSKKSATSTTTKPSTAKAAKQRQRRSLLTRRHFYYILKDKFERHGLNGEACLLRLICETNASELGEINGVLGSLVHILFSPSTSMHEHLPLCFYQAEVDGQHEHCQHYEEECDLSLLDLISAPLLDIIAEMEEKVHKNIL